MTFDAVFNDVLKMASVHYVHMWFREWRHRQERAGLFGHRNVGLLCLALQW